MKRENLPLANKINADIEIVENMLDLRKNNKIRVFVDIYEVDPAHSVSEKDDDKGRYFADTDNMQTEEFDEMMKAHAAETNESFFLRLEDLKKKLTAKLETL